MEKEIKSGRTPGEHKKPQRKRKDPDKWTFGRSVLFLLITLNLIAVLVWLIYYHSHYETISKIVGGVWGAIITFLSYMKIKRGRKKSLVQFLQILPVKMVIITYTVIIFLAAGIFVFAEFPIHTVFITAYLDNNPQSGVSIAWDDKPYSTGEDGILEIHSVKAGEHTLSARFNGYKLETRIVTVYKWPINQPKEIHLRPELGNIRISSHYEGKAENGAEIYIDDKKENKTTPATIENLPVGVYSVKLIKIVGNSRLKGIKEITVEADKTTEEVIVLEREWFLGDIRISSHHEGKAENGAEIYIDDKKENKTTPATIENLPVGAYSVKLIKIAGDFFYSAEKEIMVEAGKTTEAEMQLILRRLCKLYIRSKPTGASIFINEEPKGTTDTTVKLPPGTYMIRLEKSGYKTTYKEVLIEELNNSITISLSAE